MEIGLSLQENILSVTALVKETYGRTNGNRLESLNTSRKQIGVDEIDKDTPIDLIKEVETKP